VDRRQDRRGARPVHRPPASRQITLAEASADTYVDAFRKTPLHDEHLAAGARMDRFGGWWRPWHYGDAVSEYWAVREGVSIGDVSTLGKLVVSGPDVVELLERLYPCNVADIKPGRSRYALLLNERGHVMDDGMILRDSETRFVLSFTSGGAASAEMWIRDWIDVWGSARPRPGSDDVARRDQRDGTPGRDPFCGVPASPTPPRFLGHVRTDVAGVPCHVMRFRSPARAAFELHTRSTARSSSGVRSSPSAPTWASGRTAPGVVRAAAREGPRHRRDGHRARHDAPAAWDGPGRSAWRSSGSSGGPRSTGPPSSLTTVAGSDSRCWSRTARGCADLVGGEVVGNVTGAGSPRCSGKP
jgi:hypothetical protein